MTLNETNSYCSNQNLKTVQIVSLIKSQVIFTSDFMVRAFTSGCYYYSTITGKWSSLGMEIEKDSNVDMTHCVSTLTN